MHKLNLMLLIAITAALLSACASGSGNPVSDQDNSVGTSLRPTPSSAPAPTIAAKASASNPRGIDTDPNKTPTSQVGANPTSGAAVASADDERPELLVSPPFNASDYMNGDEIINLIESVGLERPYPVELLPSSPELPNSLAAVLVTEFLNDTRVVTVKKGFRDTTIDRIEDYCDNGTRTIQYLDGGTRASGQRGARVKEAVGFNRWWSIEHTDNTNWNAPYITGTNSVDTAAYQLGGWDALGFPRLNPPRQSGFPQIGSNSSQFIRVFSNPDCQDVEPILDYGSTLWSLLGIEQLIAFPTTILSDAAPLTGQDLIDEWEKAFTNIATFSNLNGFPVLYFCGNNRGVMMHPYHSRLRQPFTWKFEDATYVANNAVRLTYEYDDKRFGIGEDIFAWGPRLEDSPSLVVAAKISDCTVENGQAYVDTFTPNLEWWNERPATPTPRLEGNATLAATAAAKAATVAAGKAQSKP